MSNFYRFYHVILSMEIWLIGLAILIGMLYSPTLIAAPMIGLFYALLRLVVEKRLPGPTPADIALGLLIILLFINLALSPTREQSMTAVLRMLGGVALYFAVVHWAQTSMRIKYLVAITGIAALGLCFLSLFAASWVSYKLFFVPIFVYDYLPKIISDPIHPNVLAGSLIAIIPLGLAIPLFNFRKSSPIERWMYPVILIITVGVLLLTQSRSAILALLLAILIVLILRSKWFWLLPALGIGGAASLVIFFGMANIKMQLVEFISLAGLAQRSDIWHRTLYMIQDFPLTGVSMGNFPDAFQIFYPMALNPDRLLPHAHNIFLQVGADLGIPGLVLWLGVLITTFVAAWKVFRTARRWQQPWLAAIGAGLIGCQLAIIIHGMFDSVLWSEVRTAPLIWWLWGLTMAALNLIHQSRHPKVVISNYANS